MIIVLIIIRPTQGRVNAEMVIVYGWTVGFPISVCHLFNNLSPGKAVVEGWVDLKSQSSAGGRGLLPGASPCIINIVSWYALTGTYAYFKILKGLNLS